MNKPVFYTAGLCKAMFNLISMAVLLLYTLVPVSLYASHHIDCNNPANFSNPECAGLIDCNDPINLIYPQCQGGGTVTPPPPANVAPVADFSISPASGSAPLTVTLDARASRDSDGSITLYAWTSSDGQSSSGRLAKITFATAGNYNITLKITDNQGKTDTQTHRLTVTEPAPDCTAVFDQGTARLLLMQVDLINGQDVTARFSNLVMQLLPTENSNFLFQVIAAELPQGQALTDANCVTTYDVNNGRLLVPAIKIGSTATKATFINAIMLPESISELIFQLQSIQAAE